jgi:murein DD-endopeptidase MepM/ murein hydrolase activator NlpD
VAALVGPGQSKQIVKLSVTQPGAAFEFPFHWSFTYGDPYAKHDETARYRMPFGGKQERELTQGQNGRFSHTGTSRYSFDFGMPVGTPILAARRGEVVEVNDGFTESGVAPAFLDKANAVTILHEDGTFATYAHLDPGAGVRQGMKVAVGDVLGFSGNTGFSTGPHLHFSVWQATVTNDQGSTTVPIRFYDSRPAGFVPKRRSAYAPTCHSEGNRCKPGELPARPASYGATPIEKNDDGTCLCGNGSIITTALPCRVVCP